MLDLNRTAEELRRGIVPCAETLKQLLSADEETRAFFAALAREARQAVYGEGVYIRGLIEFTDYCRNDCYYCGIRRGNANARRYRLSQSEILDCCRNGYELGFRTFVLQGGEDPYYDDKKIVEIVAGIKSLFPDAAVTLSLGEKSKDSYRLFYRAGADRYLLRHETADAEHYRMLHPPLLTAENRRRCLYDLKEIGYQVGCGFMVGSPYQTAAHIRQDLLFISELQPHMIGIGPFIPHRDTPFADFSPGLLNETLILLSILRLLFPRVLLPSTTALASLAADGREKGIAAGANVVMPNLSPPAARQSYLLYDGKADTGISESLEELSGKLKSVGCHIALGRGDYKKD